MRVIYHTLATNGKKVQYTTNQPSASTDYLAADNTWKAMTGGGGGVPTTRTLTINGTAQDLSADRTWNVGDMLKSVYDTDVDGVVDSAERIQIVVRNSTGSTLTKGQIVYLSGATGNRPNALLAKADAEATSSKTIGMVIADIPNNSDGSISVNGTLHDLDTSAFTAGDSLWLSATTAGGMVANTPPAEPNHAVFIGFVARVHPTQGRVVLAIQNGYELDELHGVQITSVANGQVLTYNSTSNLWVNQSIPATTSTQLWNFQLANTIALSATTWIGVGLTGGTNESTATVIMPFACTLSDMYTMHYNTTQPATGSQVFTVRKNGVDTALAITISAGSVPTTTPYSNTTNSVTFAAGDKLSIRRTNNAVAIGGAVNGLSFKLTI